MELMWTEGIIPGRAASTVGSTFNHLKPRPAGRYIELSFGVIISLDNDLCPNQHQTSDDMSQVRLKGSFD